VALKDRTRLCAGASNIAEGELCGVCQDPRRDVQLLCVVEEVNDLLAIEKSREYRGLYHVLEDRFPPGGPGAGSDRAKELLARLGTDGVQEVILATNPNVEGEATALYLLRLLKQFPVKVTRIARGLPMGGDLEYADEVTLARALEGRREIT